MITTDTGNRTIQAIAPGTVYATSILKVARHFWTAREDVLVRDLAEEFRRRPNLPVVAVLDGSGKALGVVRAERLFSLLGKPFGIEILGKSRVVELVEDRPRWPAGAELFSVAGEALADLADDRPRWFILEDGEGRFAGVFSAQDLANHLSGITRADVESAGALQDRLLAGHGGAEGEGWRFEAWSRSAKGIGGDLHFARKISGTEGAFSLCDVSGKGVAASVLVSMAWGMQRMHDDSRGLAHLLRELNAAVIEAFHMEKYLTGLFMRLDRTRLRLEVADMGHSHVLVFRGGVPGRVRTTRTNLPLGLEPGLEPKVAVWTLEPGDLVFAYTDGFTEQHDFRGVEYGEARLRESVLRCLAAGSPLGSGVPAAFDRFRAKVPQLDDASFVALSVF